MAEPFLDFTEPAFWSKNAGSGDAGLPAVAEPCRQHLRDGDLEIGIVQNDAGAFAAKFHCDALHSGRCRLNNAATCGSGTGEGDLGHVAVSRECRTNDASIPGDDIENAIGKTGRVQAFSDHLRLQGAHL